MTVMQRAMLSVVQLYLKCNKAVTPLRTNKPSIASYSPTFGIAKPMGAEPLADWVFGKGGWEWHWECVADCDSYYLIPKNPAPGYRQRWRRVVARAKELSK